MKIYGTFYGYEQRTNVSRLFKIYATNQGILGGWIAPCDYEEMLARFAGNNMLSQNIAGMRQVAQNAESWERHYDTLLPDEAQFLGAQKENFAFAAEEVGAAVTWGLKFTEKSATRFGALDITPTGGKKRRFYLVGQRTPAEVSELVQKAFPQASIESVATQAFTEQNTGIVSAAPVHKKVNWLIVIPVYFAAIFLSLWIADEFNFWLPLGVSVVSLPIYHFIRSLSSLFNFQSNTAKQLQYDRDRAAQEAQG